MPAMNARVCVPGVPMRVVSVSLRDTHGPMRILALWKVKTSSNEPALAANKILSLPLANWLPKIS